jgi:hypothetical protein
MGRRKYSIFIPNFICYFSILTIQVQKLKLLSLCLSQLLNHWLFRLVKGHTVSLPSESEGEDHTSNSDKATQCLVVADYYRHNGSRGETRFKHIDYSISMVRRTPCIEHITRVVQTPRRRRGIVAEEAPTWSHLRRLCR